MADIEEASTWQERLRRSFKVVVELSSVLTIFSFVASSMLLFVTLMLNGIRFTDVVTVDDIVIAGVDFAARGLTIFVFVLPVAFLYVVWFGNAISGGLEALRSKEAGFLSKAGAVYLLAAGALSLAFLLLSGLIVAVLGGTAEAAALFDADDRNYAIGLVLAGWLYALWVTWRQATRAAAAPARSAGPTQPAQPAQPAQSAQSPGPGRAWDSELILKAMIVYCSILSLIGAFAERAWASQRAAESPGTVLVEPVTEAACARDERRVLWIGTNAVVIACGNRRVIVKGPQNVVLIAP